MNIEQHLKELIERELRALAYTPILLADLERLEIEALAAIARPGHPYRERAKLILRMSAEIRKSRGVGGDMELTDREIDAEIADVCNRMG